MKKTETELPTVEYRRGNDVIDLQAAGYGRVVRRLIKGHGAKLQRKYGHLVHPETGERPTIVLHMTEDRIPRFTGRLVTDSQPLREWLKSKGIVIEEVVAVDEAVAVEGHVQEDAAVGRADTERAESTAI